MRCVGNLEDMPPEMLGELYCSDHTPLNSKVGDQLMDQCLSKPTHPRVLFIQNDTMAIGALKAIKKHGLNVTQDIAIVSCETIQKRTASELESVRSY